MSAALGTASPAVRQQPDTRSFVEPVGWHEPAHYGGAGAHEHLGKSLVLEESAIGPMTLTSPTPP